MAEIHAKSSCSDMSQYQVSTYLGTIQVLHHQGGGLVQKMAIIDDLQYRRSSKSWVGGPKKVKTMMT